MKELTAGDKRRMADIVARCEDIIRDADRMRRELTADEDAEVERLAAEFDRIEGVKPDAEAPDALYFAKLKLKLASA